MPSIAVIIVTYNAQKWISKCIDPLLDHATLKVIVVDNASTDATSSILKAEKYHSIHLVLNSQNKGFGAANNQGIEWAMQQNIPYVFLLNQDAHISPDSLLKLKSGLESHPDTGILSPMHYFDEDTLDKGFEAHLEEHTVAIDGQYQTVKFVNAALWMISTKRLKEVKAFDPLFFHYGEDRDFCMRLNARSIPILIDREVKGYHYRPQTIDFKDYSKEKQLLLNQYGLLARLKHSPTLFGPYLKAWGWSGLHMINGWIRRKKDVRFVHSKLWIWLSNPATFVRIKKNTYR